MRGVAEPREWKGHVVVCGLDDLTLRTVEQLHEVGARVAVIHDARDERLQRIVEGWEIPVLVSGAHETEALLAAGLEGAASVICSEASDLRTLETVLLVRQLRPDARVVAHIDNPAVARAVEEVTGAGSVLDIPALFGPAVVEACLERRVHELEVGGERFVTVETVAERAGTLRELYGSLVPLGIARDATIEPVLCPGRDERVAAGERVTMLGSYAQLEEAGMRPQTHAPRPSLRASALSRLRRLGASVARESDRALRVVAGLAIALVCASTLILHLSYRPAGGGHLSVLNSLYFTVETVSTVGYGDFSFAGQSSGMRVFALLLIVGGSGLIAATFALVTNMLVSRRIERSLGHGQIPGMQGHVVIIGLGGVGLRVLEGIVARGRDVVVVERSEGNRYLGEVRRLGVPLVIGDGALGPTLDAVGLARASAVAIMTSDDLANIEIGVSVRDRLGERWGEVPVVLRVAGRRLGHRLSASFGFRHVWSTEASSAPWLVGAALGMDVLYSFYVGNHPFLVARLRVSPGGGLDGVAMADLGALVRVVAIGRGGRDGTLEHPPRRETRFAAGDDAYVAGPYEGLLEVLRRERAGTAGPGG
jgi:Trk K+ transport system NAD-binding subunit